MVNALLRRLSQLSLPVALFALPLLLPVPVHSQETTVQSRASETEVADPASEVAPPGLVVEAGDAPIDATIALRMQQELMQLLGRVESALVAAQSLGQLGDVALQSLDAELQGVTMSYVDGGTQVEAAKTLLREFPGLVRQGETMGRHDRGGWRRDRNSGPVTPTTDPAITPQKCAPFGSIAAPLFGPGQKLDWNFYLTVLPAPVSTQSFLKPSMQGIPFIPAK